MKAWGRRLSSLMPGSFSSLSSRDEVEVSSPSFSSLSKESHASGSYADPRSPLTAEATFPIPSATSERSTVLDSKGWAEEGIHSTPPGSRRKSEDRQSNKRSRHESSSGRVNTHEIWALPSPQEARPSSPTVKVKESRLKLRDRDGSKSALAKENEQLAARVRELQDQVRALDRERQRELDTSMSVLSKDNDHLAARVRELQSQLRAVEREREKDNSKAVLVQENEHLNARVRELQDHMRAFEERERILESRCKHLEDELQRSSSNHRRGQADVEKMISDNKLALDNASRQIQELRSKNQHLESKVKMLQSRTHYSDSKHSETAALLDMRTAELRSAQTFLNKADIYSGGDIIRMVDGLNSEIFQCSAFVAETVMGEENVPAEEASVIVGVRKEVANIHGERLVSLLEKNAQSNRDPLPLQTALQMTLIRYCILILTSFVPDDEAVNKKLSVIYEQASSTEEQAVVGRWRAITMAQLRAFHTSKIHQMTRDIIKFIILAGGSRRSRNYNHLLASIKSRLVPIEHSIYALKQAIGEGITSTDVVPFAWPCSHPYDGGVVMENMYPDDRDKAVSEEALKGQAIIGTAEMGVQKVTATKLPDGTMFRQKDILTKPKIIMAHTLEEMAETTAKSVRSVTMS